MRCVVRLSTVRNGPASARCRNGRPRRRDGPPQRVPGFFLERQDEVHDAERVERPPRTDDDRRWAVREPFGGRKLLIHDVDRFVDQRESPFSVHREW